MLGHELSVEPSALLEYSVSYEYERPSRSPINNEEKTFDAYQQGQ
jgi:hypothetical protein